MTSAPDPLIPGTLDVLAGTPSAVRSLLAALPDDVATRHADGRWSPRDVVAHMLAVEPRALVERVHLMVAEDDPVIAGVDEDEALVSSGLLARPLPWLLDEFDRARAEHLRWLRALTPAQLARSGRHEQLGVITVANVLHHIAFHDLNHLRQIASMLEPAFDAERGPMRGAY